MKQLCRLMVFIALANMAHADGGHVRFQQVCGSFNVTLFTAPEPLTIGDADFSVMLQDRSTQQVVFDASIDVLLRSPGGETKAIHLRRKPSGNRLLESAAVSLRTEGLWTATVIIHRGFDQASCTTSFNVERGSSRKAIVIFFLIIPLAGIALFLIQQAQRDRIARIVQARSGANARRSTALR
jgi:hypothetical protein